MVSEKLKILDVEIFYPGRYPLAHTYYRLLTPRVQQGLPGSLFRRNTIRSRAMFHKLRVMSDSSTIIVRTNLKNFRFTIKEGLCSDFGTVPKIGKIFLDGDSYYMVLPSVLHDIMYIWGSVDNDISFEDATEFISAMMTYYSAPKIAISSTVLGLNLSKKYYGVDSDFYSKSREYCSVSVTPVVTN